MAAEQSVHSFTSFTWPQYMHRCAECLPEPRKGPPGRDAKAIDVRAACRVSFDRG